MVTVERRDGPRAARGRGFLWVGEPQPKMEGVDGVERRVPRGVLVVHLRCWHAFQGERVGLLAEDAYDAHRTIALVVGV